MEQTSASRTRLRVATALAAASGLLFALTAVRPDWVVAGFGRDPHGGSGSLEWLVAGAQHATAVTSAGLAWRERRRLAA